MGELKFVLLDTLKEKKFPKYRLSKITNIEYDTIMKYCKGTIKRIHIEHLILICNTLNCDIVDIVQYKCDSLNEEKLGITDNTKYEKDITIKNGKLKFVLIDTLEKKKFPKYRLSKVTNIEYDTIMKYCKGTIKRINTEHLIQLCNTLDCDIVDILQYQ